MDFILTLLIALLLSLCFIAIRTKRSKTILPPGPPGLPILGSLLDLGEKPHQDLANLAKTYGPLMSLKLGQITVVVVSSKYLAKEVLQTHDLSLSDRAELDAARAINHIDDAIPWLPIGKKWRTLRKACKSYLLANRILEQKQQLRLSKIQDLLDKVDECCREGKAVNIERAAFETSLNYMSNTMLSLNLTDTNSETAREFKSVVASILEETGKPNLADFFPMLRRLDLQGLRRRTAVLFGKILTLLDRIIEERVLARKSEGYVGANDMLDSLLVMAEERKEEMDVHRIKHLFMDLFVAGTETTSTTLEWAVAELLHNPKILSKAKAELEEIIGKDKLLEESDIARLPYLQAVIKEVFRLHPPTPLLIPRKARADVQVCGYTVPKDAHVMVNAWAIGRDPSLWEDPLSFVPERFLMYDMDVRGQNFELIPFGAGRRICPGMPLAMKMLPLMLGSLIHAYHWKLEDGISPENLNMEEKLSLSIKMAQPLRAIPIQV